jgi:uncharacterized protein (DUF2141 family)
MKIMSMRSSFLVIFYLILTASVLFLFSGCSDSTDATTGVITGNVSAYNVSVQGDIYVLAVKAENRGRLRNMETEAYPYESQYAAGYQKLTAQGAYLISGLEPGQYAVWAYMDTGGDGGVNHYNFADPVGWYQTSADLKLPVVTVNKGQVADKTDVVLYQPVRLVVRNNRSFTATAAGPSRRSKEIMSCMYGELPKKGRMPSAFYAPRRYWTG